MGLIKKTIAVIVLLLLSAPFVVLFTIITAIAWALFHSGVYLAEEYKKEDDFR